MPDTAQPVVDLVERCIHAFELDGEKGLEVVLEAGGPLAATAREHVEVLRQSGLLRLPELPAAIGPYRILKRLGSGGMGTVFLAEQGEPLLRRVAAKVIRPGMDTHDVLARFAVERKALAALDHRSIARILDAGSTADERPYLVMEYVPGQPIHRYCDDRQLDTRERLQLFLQVCDAVQHAHHKGILHRDLKPSNILVADRDGTPTPVVIDFGVAKSVGSPFDQRGQLTLPGRLLGTPEYMSPEQAAVDSDVDTRTDVYSLGVVLYELLTSTLPVNGGDLRRGDTAQVLRDAVPATPSTSITGLGEAAELVARQRRTSVGTLRKTLRGDLDWIVLKVLERDRNRRYGMPAELAADIQRHLHQEPVTAGAPGAWYRCRRFCARNRLQVVAAAMVLGALSTGLVVSTVFYREAAASSEESTASLDAALQAVDELVLVSDNDLVNVPHLEGIRRSLLERAVAFYRQFLDRRATVEPRLLPRTLDALVRLGSMHVQLGQHDAARQLFHEAENLLASPAAVVLPAARRQETVADTSLGMALVHERAAEGAAALAAARRATDARRELERTHPDDPRTVMALQRCLKLQANLLRQVEPATAMALFDEALAKAQQLQVRQPTDPAAIAAVLEIGAERADLLLSTGKREACLAAVAALRALRATQRGSRSYALAIAMTDVANLLHRCERSADALEVVGDTAPDLERLVADHPSVVGYRGALIRLLNVRGNAEMNTRDFPAALATQRRVRTECEAALAVTPADLAMQRQLIICCINLATYQNEWRSLRGDWDASEVEAALQRATAELDGIPAGEPQRRARAERMEVLRLWGLLRASRGDRAPACTDLAAAMAIAEELVAESPATIAYQTRLAEMRRRLAGLLLDLGRMADARAIMDRAVADSAALAPTSDGRSQWASRHRDLLLLQVRAHGGSGDLASAFTALEAQLALGDEHDWIGRQAAAQAMAQLLASLPATAPTAPRVLARGRELVAEALGYEAGYRERGTGHGTTAVMRGNTLQVARQLELAGGDFAAAATRAGAAVEAFAAAWQATPNDRNEQRVCDAAGPWLGDLQQLGDAAGAERALHRLAELFAGRPAALAHAAALAAKAPADAAAAAAWAPVRQPAIELLRLAVAAGLDADALQGERFAAWHGEPAFRALVDAAARR